MKTPSNPEPKIHFNDKYTIWCANGHTASEIVKKLLSQLPDNVVLNSSEEIPDCPICHGKLLEGAVN